MSEFMPEGYVEPKNKNAGTYFKLNDQTKNEETKRIKIIGTFNHPHTAIMGWEAWSEDTDPETGKVRDIPIRKENTTENYDELMEVDRDGSPRHFWAMQIYNLDDAEPQIWGITQKTIQRQIRQLSENPNWGNPSGYVIAVNRFGTGLQTKYTLTAAPPMEPPSDDILKAMAEAKIDCREMFGNEGKGNNPFGAFEGENDEMPF